MNIEIAVLNVFPEFHRKVSFVEKIKDIGTNVKVNKQIKLMG